MKDAMRIAKQTAGWREKYAMKNGNKNAFIDHRGHTIWRYTYSKYREYQDANGAMFDVTERRWVG